MYKSALFWVFFLLFSCTAGLAEQNSSMPHQRRHSSMPHSNAIRYTRTATKSTGRATSSLPHQAMQRNNRTNSGVLPHWNMHRTVRPGMTKGGQPLYEVKDLPHWAKHRKVLKLTKGGEKVYMMIDLPHWAKHRRLLMFKNGDPVYVALPMPHKMGSSDSRRGLVTSFISKEQEEAMMDELIEETDLPIYKGGPGQYYLSDVSGDDFRQRFCYKAAEIEGNVYFYMDLPHWARHRKVFRATKGGGLVFAVIDMPHQAKHRKRGGLTKGGLRRWEASSMPHHAKHRKSQFTKSGQSWTSRALPHWARHGKELSEKETKVLTKNSMPHHARHKSLLGSRSHFRRQHNAMPHTASHNR